MALSPGRLLVGEIRETFGKAKIEFGGQGLPPPNIIDIVKKTIASLPRLFNVGTLYTGRLRSTDVNPWSHYEKSFGYQQTRQCSLPEGPIPPTCFTGQLGY